MAKDDNTNDKDQDDFFEDDNDFGLPELNYEALDSDDSTASDSKEESFDDSGSTDDLYTEESFDDFDTSANENREGVSTSDSEGDLVFSGDEDWDTEDENERVEKTHAYEATNTSSATKSKSTFAKVVVIGLLVFFMLGFGFWYLSPTEQGENSELIVEAAKPKVESPKEVAKPVKSTTKKSDDDTSKAKEQPVTKPKPKKVAPAKSVATSGKVNTLSARTGNYYVIIGSFLDSDMAMKYATQLASVDKGSFIIPPFGKAVTHRIAIAGYPTLSNAEKALDNLKSEYSSDIWILKY